MTGDRLNLLCSRAPPGQSRRSHHSGSHAPMPAPAARPADRPVATGGGRHRPRISGMETDQTTDGRPLIGKPAYCRSQLKQAYKTLTRNGLQHRLSSLSPSVPRPAARNRSLSLTRSRSPSGCPSGLGVAGLAEASSSPTSTAFQVFPIPPAAGDLRSGAGPAEVCAMSPIRQPPPSPQRHAVHVARGSIAPRPGFGRQHQERGRKPRRRRRPAAGRAPRDPRRCRALPPSTALPATPRPTQRA